jgi:hypothetical protein
MAHKSLARLKLRALNHGGTVGWRLSTPLGTRQALRRSRLGAKTWTSRIAADYNATAMHNAAPRLLVHADFGGAWGTRGTAAQQAARAVYSSDGAHGTRSEAFGRVKPRGERKSSMGALEAGWRSRGVYTNNGGFEVVRRTMAVATRPACVGAGFVHGGEDAPGVFGPESSARTCSHKTATRRRAQAASSATKGLGEAQGAATLTCRNRARGLCNCSAARHFARLGWKPVKSHKQANAVTHCMHCMK